MDIVATSTLCLKVYSSLTFIRLISIATALLFVMAFMTLPALKRGKLTRTQGIILLAVYAAFCVFQFAYK